MKKLTTIVAGFILLFSASAFTSGEENVSVKVRAVFEKDFTDVSEVAWSKSKDKDVYIASFKSNDKNLMAAYSEDGELLAITRYISLSQVPLSVARNMKKQYADYTLDQSVIELSNESTSYFINAENKKNKLVIQADVSGSLWVVKKIKK